MKRLITNALFRENTYRLAIQIAVYVYNSIMNE